MNRSRASVESQTVTARQPGSAQPDRNRRAPSGRTGPVVHRCAATCSACRAVCLESSRMLQMATASPDALSSPLGGGECLGTVDPRLGGVISAIAGSLLNSLARPGCELGAVLEPGLGQRVADVALDRAHRQVQVRGDLLVRASVGHEADNFELTGTEAGGGGWARSSRAERERR